MMEKDRRQALSDRLFWAAYVDLKEDRLVPTTAGGVCQNFYDILSEVKSYSKFLEIYPKNFVTEPYREDVACFLDPANIEVCTKDGQVCMLSYSMITSHGNQRRMMMSIFSADGVFGSGKYTITANSTDDEYNILTNSEDPEKNETEESKSKVQRMMLHNMEEVYYSITSIHVLDHSFQEIISGEGIHPVIQDIKDAQVALDLCVEMFVSNADRSIMEQFFDLDTVPLRLGNQDKISAEFYATTGNWFRVMYRPITRDERGAVTEVLLATKIINEEKRQAEELQEKIDELQYSDSLTGLLNRKGFILSAEKILFSETTEERKKYSFLYTNIHNFKLYNVEFGADNGDVVLKYVADGLPIDGGCLLAARLGQDHLVVMTKQSDEEMQNEAVRFASIFHEKYNHLGLSYKIGSYRIKTGEETVYAACEFAKLACDSIRSTSECYRQYDEVLGRKIERNSYVLRHIDEAIENQYLRVYFQPVMRTLSDKICGMEALSRWIDPKYGLLSPADFIPVLEENRMIAKVDLYILRQVCKMIKIHLENDKPIVPVSVNLSRINFEEGDIFCEVERIVIEEDVPRQMINIEITESVLLNDDGAIKRKMEQFRDAGYQIWMDDFGSGFSSLNVLKDYQFDEIKLDMRFLESFDERSKEIVRSVIEMAKRIGVQTLAEGVETREQYDFLCHEGCEKVQGYFISKPICYEDVVSSFLARHENVENTGYRKYYDIIGRVDVMTDKPLALIEWDGTNFNYLFANAEYEREMISTGVKDIEAAHQNMNVKDSPLNKMFVSFSETCKVGEEEKELIYSVRGNIIRVVTSCIAEFDKQKTFQTRVMNLSGLQDESLRMMNRLEADRKISGGYEFLWNSFKDSNLISMFCKDVNHRFMGVNEKFLQTYGFEDISAVLGKTDEEMGWHPNDKPFYDDEERVLKDGESMINRIGECVVKGKVHKIIASKEPIYQDHEIVGLIGIFIDLDELKAYLQKNMES